MPSSNSSQSASSPSDTDRSHQARWGGYDQIFEDGYVPVPVTFLTYMAQMAPYILTPAEALFVIQLMAFKWDKSAPYPSYSTLADRMGVTKGYARKIARRLERKGFLERVSRKGRTNAFDLTGLFEELANHIREQREAEENEKPSAEGPPPEAGEEVEVALTEDDLPF